MRPAPDAAQGENGLTGNGVPDSVLPLSAAPEAWNPQGEGSSPSRSASLLHYLGGMLSEDSDIRPGDVDRPSAPNSIPPPPRTASLHGEVPLHMRRDWRPPITERSLDAALWWGQAGERVARRTERKHDTVAEVVGRLVASVDRIGKILKWIAVGFAGVWVVEVARYVSSQVATLHH